MVSHGPQYWLDEVRGQCMAVDARRRASLDIRGETQNGAVFCKSIKKTLLEAYILTCTSLISEHYLQ